MRKYGDIEARKYSSTSNQTAVLYAIAVHGGKMTPTAISKWIYVSKHAVTQVIDTLEKRKFIHRRQDSDDRRSTQVELTDKGWKKINQIMPHFADFGKRLLISIDKEHIAYLNKMFKQLRKNVLTQMEQAKNTGK